MDEEAFEMWFNRNPNLTLTQPPLLQQSLPSPPFTLFGTQNDDVESQLCRDLSRMMILNDDDLYPGIGTSREPQQQQQGFMNINTTPTPSWLHFHNNLVNEPIGIGPQQGNNMPKRTFTKEQAFRQSQVDSFSNINFGNSGFDGPGWGYQRSSQLQNQPFESFPYMCSSSRDSFINHDWDSSYREIQRLPQRTQIIRRHSLPFVCGCGSICCAATINSFQKEVPFPQSQLSYEELVRLQGSSMFEMAKEQNGCRLLQNSFDGDNTQKMVAVFDGIIDHVVPLMMDPFGNYLVQKLLDFCFDYQRLKLVLMLTKEPGHLVTISLNTHGTRVVQKLIRTIKTNMEIQLVMSAIQPCFLELIRDLNGNHVIQSCLLYLSVQDNEFIFDAATKFCVKVATHQHGCCVLQRCIEYSKGRSQDKLVKEICKHGLQLARDQFGNYVVQYIMKMENLSTSAKFTLISQFQGNYVDLSKQKFSSHVVETCLEYIPESRSSIVHEFLFAEDFEHLMQHPFANYVIQRALLVTKDLLHASLAKAVRQHKKLHTSPYCKKIFSKNLLKK